MGRSREFDESAVLTGAMHAFRRKGYAAVSIKDLEEATGLKGGSIYNSYGDKGGLLQLLPLEEAGLHEGKSSA